MMPFDPEDVVKTRRGKPLTSSESEKEGSDRTRTPTPSVEPTDKPVPKSGRSIAIDRAEAVYEKCKAARAETEEEDRGR